MTFLFEFSVFGETQIARELQGMGLRSLDPTPAWLEIVKAMQGDTKELFESQGNTGMFGEWAPLKEATIQRKLAEGLRPEILVATGALVSSLVEETDDSIIEIDPEGITYGTKLDYGAIQYKGSDKVPLPRRRPIDFSELQRREFVKILQRFIVESGR